MDILDNTAIKKVFAPLKTNQQPVFGIMRPQHMIEHLSMLVYISIEKVKAKLFFDADKAEKIKQALLYTEMEFPKGYKAPSLPENDVLPLRHSDLETAIGALHDALDAFRAFFAAYPDHKTLHPTMGLLSYEEWIIFHYKHFIHHAKQFQLV